jgi:hypothetical protein
MAVIALLALALAFLPIPAIVAIAISASCLLLLSRASLSLPSKFLVIHTAVITGITALYPTKLFIPSSPFDDVYVAYMIAPGFHIYVPSAIYASRLWPWLRTIMPEHQASMTSIVFIPGILGTIIGGIQWYLIGLAVVWFRRKRVPP